MNNFSLCVCIFHIKYQIDTHTMNCWDEWLSDAMEGRTHISALIHAHTIF
jgi:hypothetical protein